ncbi:MULTISPECIES: hypothetical protein [Enterobacterales]|uniref:hypothetical protein n=1 Tax=Enterobacterales TaxID=91347 RepID=UPI002ED77C04
MKVNLELEADNITIRPDSSTKLNVDIDGVNVVNVIDEISEAEGGINKMLELIGIDNIAEWIYTEAKVSEALGYFDNEEIINHLRTQGVEVSDESTD